MPSRQRDHRSAPARATTCHLRVVTSASKCRCMQAKSRVLMMKRLAPSSCRQVQEAVIRPQPGAPDGGEDSAEPLDQSDWYPTGRTTLVQPPRRLPWAPDSTGFAGADPRYGSRVITGTPSVVNSSSTPHRAPRRPFSKRALRIASHANAGITESRRGNGRSWRCERPHLAPSAASAGSSGSSMSPDSQDPVIVGGDRRSGPIQPLGQCGRRTSR